MHLCDLLQGESRIAVAWSLQILPVVCRGMLVPSDPLLFVVTARGVRQGPRGASGAANFGLLLLRPLHAGRWAVTAAAAASAESHPAPPIATSRAVPEVLAAALREGGRADATPSPPTPVAATLSSAPVENASSGRLCLRKTAVRGATSDTVGCGCCHAVSPRCTMLPECRGATRAPRGRQGSAICPVATGGRLSSALPRGVRGRTKQ